MELKHKNWSEISIKKFDEIKKALNTNSNNELEANLAMLAVLCDVDIQEIENMPFTLGNFPL